MQPDLLFGTQTADSHAQHGLEQETGTGEASDRIPVELIGDQWRALLPVEPSGISETPLYICWRRSMDLAFAVCCLLLLGLFLPVLALLIFLDSPGSIFYSQQRLGLHGRPFRIYKFRSMYLDAEQNGSARWATANDERVTRMGRFLRAFHLDEVPQMLNVLKGEMSLIGPRPEREEFVVELEKRIPFYRRRLTVKPGITGWAQVKYHYGSTEKDALIKVQYDLYYIKHQSFKFDISIILKTFPEVLFHRGI